MKIHLTDGTVIERPFAVANCNGFVASSIEMSADDIEAIHALAHENSNAFCQALYSLHNCYVERRFKNGKETLQ